MLSDPLGQTIAMGINDSGKIVGYYYPAFDPLQTNLANGFLYSNGVYTTIDDPLGTGGTYPKGINNSGQVVGYYIGANGLNGFLFSDGKYTTLNSRNQSVSPH